MRLYGRGTTQCVENAQACRGRGEWASGGCLCSGLAPGIGIALAGHWRSRQRWHALHIREGFQTINPHSSRTVLHCQDFDKWELQARAGGEGDRVRQRPSGGEVRRAGRAEESSQPSPLQPPHSRTHRAIFESLQSNGAIARSSEDVIKDHGTLYTQWVVCTCDSCSRRAGAPLGHQTAGTSPRMTQ